MHFVIFNIVVLGLTNFVNAAPPVLPTWFKTCKEGTIDMEKCIMEKSQVVLPHLIKGSKEFKIPNLTPFKIKEVAIQNGQNFNLKLLDVTIYGLDTAVLQSVNMSFENKIGLSKISFKEIKLDGTYDIDGRILILPIKGHGPGNFTFTDVLIDMEVTWDIIERDNFHYMDMKSIDIKYTLGNAAFLLKDLFNGDQRLGNEMNNFLNENWRDFSNDISPAISSMVASLGRKIIGHVVKSVPIEVMFPKE